MREVPSELPQPDPPSPDYLFCPSLAELGALTPPPLPLPLPWRNHSLNGRASLLVCSSQADSIVPTAGAVVVVLALVAEGERGEQMIAESEFSMLVLHSIC